LLQLRSDSNKSFRFIRPPKVFGAALLMLLVATLFLRSSARPSSGALTLFSFVVPWDDALPSATDLSSWLHKPAGKFGHIRAGADGHLYAGTEPTRFFGVNLCFGACFPSKQNAEKIAARMAKFGINIVRFHHMDRGPFPIGIIARGEDSTRNLDPEALDRLDYFIAQLKRNGIYVNLNLLVSRQFKAADGLPVEIEQLGWKEGHVPGFFYQPALELQMEYARKLLTHQNPYTGMTYVEDPAVAFVEINNEDGVIHSWLYGRIDSLPRVFLLDLQRQWNEWLMRRYGTTEQLKQAWEDGGVGLGKDEQIEAGNVCILPQSNFRQRTLKAQDDWLHFLWETENSYWQTMLLYLKGNLKLKALVTGTIVGCSTPNMMANLDCVDTHDYWQHPIFPGGGWDSNSWFVPNLTIVNETSAGLLTLSLRRVLGKPHCVTEYNHPAPNTYSSEAYPILAAYAALQDWDAIYAYNYSERSDDNWDLGRIPDFFDIDQHPTKMVSLIPAVSMFVGRDVQPAVNEITVVLTKGREIDFVRRWGQAWALVDARQLGVRSEAALLHRVSIATEGSNVPATALRPDQVRVDGSRFVSDTGQLSWDLSDQGRGVVTVNTAKSKAVIGYGSNKRFDLGGVILEPGETMQNGWCAITLTAMEGELHPLSADSQTRLIITATGYCENANMGWKNAERSTVGQDWGSAPTLVEGIPARITLLFPFTQVQAWALDERGQRKAQIPTQRDINGNVQLVIGPQWQTLWYEVTGTRRTLTATSTVTNSTTSTAKTSTNLSIVGKTSATSTTVTILSVYIEQFLRKISSIITTWVDELIRVIQSVFISQTVIETVLKVERVEANIQQRKLSEAKSQRYPIERIVNHW